MNYQKIYNQLIKKRQKEIINKKDCYCERHHIIPKSIGGTDDNTNLVNLTAREHFIAHLLLAKIYGGTMIYAVHRLMFGKTKISTNSVLYENIRKSSYITKETREKMSIKSKEKWSNESFREKHKQSMKKLFLDDEHRKKISIASKKSWESEEKRQKASNSHKGKSFHTEERKNKLRDIFLSDKNPSRGKIAVNADLKIYTFYHKEYGYVNETKRDMMIKYNTRVYEIISGKSKSSNGFYFVK